MTPKKIALLTDSSADLRWAEVQADNIFFVPLRILCQESMKLTVNGSFSSIQNMRQSRPNRD